MQKTAIIVPCYNESKRLDTKSFLHFASHAPEIHFIFVDDGSIDDTLAILEPMCRSNPTQFRLTKTGKNSGKAEAVRVGFLEAFETDFANIGYWDADLATPLNMIPRFCEVLENRGAIMVIGSRVRLLGRKIERRAYRHYLGRIFATVASLALGLPVYDTQCGAKIFRNNRELKRVFRNPFRVKWTFDVEIFARLKMFERFEGRPSLLESIVEYPLEEWLDVPGSKIRAVDFLVGIKEILTICRFLHGRGAERRYRALASD